LKGEKENISIRELFRNKLENAEVVPDQLVKKDLMRKLGRKEFLHFNPSRFNIYYLGGILAVGLAVMLIILPGTVSEKEKQPLIPSPEILNAIDTNIKSVSNEKPSNPDAESIKKYDITQPESKVINKQEFTSDKISPENEIPQNKNSISVSGITDSYTKSVIINDKSSDKNNIKAQHESPGAVFEASVLTGCIPLKIKFLNKSTSYDSCRWIFGDGGYSTEKEPEWIFDVEGNYRVVLKVYGADGNEETSSTLITVHPKPLARFEITPENAIIPDDEIRFLNYSSNAVRYIWDFGDGNTSDVFEPVYRFRKYGNYNIRLVVWSEYGCTDSLAVVNAFSGSGCYIDLPNAFIPNPGGPTGGYYSPKSDEADQVFHPVFSGVSDYQLRIFSRLGILIFESNDISIGWDGYFKGQLSEPGVYIWKVRGNYSNGEPFVKMGDVTLLRN
jgi:PKD repeat protein